MKMALNFSVTKPAQVDVDVRDSGVHVNHINPKYLVGSDIPTKFNIAIGSIERLEIKSEWRGLRRVKVLTIIPLDPERICKWPSKINQIAFLKNDDEIYNLFNDIQMSIENFKRLEAKAKMIALEDSLIAEEKLKVLETQKDTGLLRAGDYERLRTELTNMLTYSR